MLLQMVYNTKLDEWINGPHLLEGRHCHSSCALKSIDGTIDTIVIVGGYTESSLMTSSTELFNIKENRWSRGPNLPIGVNSASCVAPRNHTSYSCILIGGWSNNKVSTHWTRIWKHGLLLVIWKKQDMVTLLLSLNDIKSTDIEECHDNNYHPLFVV